MDDNARKPDDDLSMEEVFEQIRPSPTGRGARKEAEVFAPHPDGIMVLMDGKLDGFLPESELVRPIGEYKVGDRVFVNVIKTDEEEGRVVVSERRAHNVTIMKRVEKAYRDGDYVEGEIVGEVNSGYNVKLEKTINAFLPGSHSGIRKGDPYPEGTLRFKVIRFKRQKRGLNVVVSLKAIKEERIKEFFSDIELDQIVEGTVEAIHNFGAFVTLSEDISGLIPASEVSWDFSQRISDVINVGEKVTAKVIGLDKKKKKVSLSLKKMSEDPWLRIDEKYPTGSIIEGTVKSIEPFGFFVWLEPGIEGLVHISEVFWGNVKKDLRSVVSPGDRIEVKILETDAENRRISLSYRQAIGDPWKTIEEDYQIGSIVEGKAAKVLPTGAIVEITEVLSGFVPVSEISWNFVDRVEDVVREGETIQAKIISIDKENKRMRLSIKQTTEDPWVTVSKKIRVGSRIKGTIVRITKAGAIVLVDDYNVEAFLPISQVSTERVEDVSDHVQVGHKQDFKVIRLVYDPEKDTRNMVVSIRQLLKDRDIEEARRVMNELNDVEETRMSLGEKIKRQMEDEKN